MSIDKLNKYYLFVFVILIGDVRSRDVKVKLIVKLGG